MSKHITDDVETSSDKEHSDKENSDKDYSQEISRMSFLREQFWKCIFWGSKLYKKDSMNLVKSILVVLYLKHSSYLRISIRLQALHHAGCFKRLNNQNNYQTKKHFTHNP